MGTTQYLFKNNGLSEARAPLCEKPGQAAYNVFVIYILEIK
jgi:hypothetical protein